jgi:hypothetical protein
MAQLLLIAHPITLSPAHLLARLLSIPFPDSQFQNQFPIHHSSFIIHHFAPPTIIADR